MRNPYVWAPINIGDWNTATQGLSLEAQAIVMKLLLLFWADGEFPEDRTIPRLMGVSPKRWLDLQEQVSAGLNKFLCRSGFMDERVRAAKTSEERRKAINTRWAKYRERATQGLDTNVDTIVDTNVIPSTSTEETYTDRAQKLTMDKGLGNKSSWAGTVTPLRPNGKLRH